MRFVNGLLFIGLFAIMPAIAQETKKLEEKKEEITCGKTTKECQEQVNKLNAQIQALNVRISNYRVLLQEANDRTSFLGR